MDKVIFHKIESIERCLQRIDDKYVEQYFATDFDMQDIVILNLQRACEMSIDIANRVLKLKQLGLPKDSVEAFMTLSEAGIIDGNLAKKLKKMVGFRNIAVHDYTNINLDIVQFVVRNSTYDMRIFMQKMIQL